MKIAFYGINKSLIQEINNAMSVPRTGEHLTLDGKKEYIVMLVTHNYARSCVQVWLRPASSNDMSFMGT